MPGEADPDYGCRPCCPRAGAWDVIGTHLEARLVSDLALRLAPRSGVADADLALLRVARTNLDELAHAAPVTIADRLRGLSPFRSRHANGPVAGSRPGRSRG